MRRRRDLSARDPAACLALGLLVFGAPGLGFARPRPVAQEKAPLPKGPGATEAKVFPTFPTLQRPGLSIIANAVMPDLLSNGGR